VNTGNIVGVGIDNSWDMDTGKNTVVDNVVVGVLVQVTVEVLVE
jgi:hypothetical protein